VIADYDGTVLIVSHDRDFLDRTVTITLGLDGSGKVDVVSAAADRESSGRSNVLPCSPSAAGIPPRRRLPKAKLTTRTSAIRPAAARIEEILSAIARDEAAPTRRHPRPGEICSPDRRSKPPAPKGRGGRTLA
jgi:ATP-binding cassette subfamily F protein uup